MQHLTSLYTLDFIHKKYKFKKDVGEFFQKVIDLGFRVTLWTCAQQDNAHIMFEALEKQVKDKVGVNISELPLLDQSKCEEAYDNPRGERQRMMEMTKPYFYKSLAMLFFYNTICRASIDNTLFIDNTPMKNLLNHPYSAIHPLPFNQVKEARKPPYLTKTLLPFFLELHGSGMTIQEFCVTPSLPHGQNWPL